MNFLDALALIVSAFAFASCICIWKELDDIKDIIAIIGNLAIDEEIRELVKRRMKDED